MQAIQIRNAYANGEITLQECIARLAALID